MAEVGDCRETWSGIFSEEADNNSKRDVEKRRAGLMK